MTGRGCVCVWGGGGGRDPHVRGLRGLRGVLMHK